MTCSRILSQVVRIAADDLASIDIVAVFTRMPDPFIREVKFGCAFGPVDPVNPEHPPLN